MSETTWGAAPFLDKVLTIVPGIIYVYNQKTQSNEYANNSLAAVLGYSAEEAQTMGDAMIPTLAHPDDLPRILAHFEAIRSLPDDEVISVEYRLRHKVGHWIHLISYDAVFDRDETGAVLRHIGKAVDVTNERTKEAEAIALSQELEVIFNAATSGIVALAADGTVLRINDRARHMFGGLSDMVPFPWPKEVKFLDAENMTSLDASADPVRRALNGHVLTGETHLMRRPDGPDERRYVRVSSKQTDTGQNDIHTVLVVDDISEEERNRQVVERKGRLDALGQLTGGIAHDFNNLLAALLYAVDMAGRAKTPEDRTASLDTASQSIEQGRELTSRLLAFARRQPGKVTVESTDKTLSEFALLIRPMLEAQVHIKRDPVPSDLLHLCDQAQLETALMNLALNARDAIMRSGKGSQITISARPVRDEGTTLDARQTGQDQLTNDTQTFRYVEITVTDNGPGMSPETLERCIDPFFTTKDSNSGTGLGLAIVYGFARQAGGDMRIYSEEGLGTTVQLTLPRGNTEGMREAPAAKDEVREGSGQTLLVVEDEPRLLLMISALLRDLGFEVITANSGQSALALVEEGTAFDLLLTDIVMPGQIGGFELARRVRALRPDVPVLYTSGFTAFSAEEIGEVQAPVLQKPTPPAELSAAIHAALGL